MKISHEIIEELSSAEISPDGLTLVLGRQVERKLYMQINNVLAALGGSWKRNTGHVFDQDVRPALEAALTSGSVTTGSDLGFFETPCDLARALIAIVGVKPGDLCLEPSAGLGRIAIEILNQGASVVAIERDEKRRAALQFALAYAEAAYQYISPIDDFMDYEPEAPFDHVVMNPPFLKCGKGDHLDHAQHAFGMLIDGGTLVSVLPAGVQFRHDRRHEKFRAWVDDHGGTLTALPTGSFKPSGTSVSTCTLLMRRAKR